MDETPLEPGHIEPPPASAVPEPEQPRKRRWRLPLALFAITCLSTFWAGAVGPAAAALIYPPDWPELTFNWADGLKYMLPVMAILLAHEMGHFLLTLRHRIPASWPFFIPMPLSPIGTMGAVIAMQAFRANRRQLFDIGIAGPLAGLVVAIPVTYLGILHGEPAVNISPRAHAEEASNLPVRTYRVTEFHDPLLVKLMVRWLRPDVSHGEFRTNPLWMAGWVGLLITGLNMLPISQLDGGHISYALFGRRAHLLARCFVLGAVVFVVATNAYMWSLMLLLIMFIGIDHPPTADDRVPLGSGRKLLGLASLAIPVLCFPPMGISVYLIDVPVRTAIGVS